ncbi:MAG: response regulator, partial [Caulobacteraceae bacterium]
MAPTNILLIDDDEVDRTSVRRALNASSLTHELTETGDGASGLAAAQARAFDCVLLDYRLPDVDS